MVAVSGRQICNNNAMIARRIFAYVLGAVEALLLARLALRLLAARPGNPVVAALYSATTPPPPFAALDQGQPRFGATLELSTLALFLLVLLGSIAIGRVWATYDHRRMAHGVKNE